MALGQRCPPPHPSHVPPPHAPAVEFLQEHRRLLEGRLDPVTREIMDTRARAKEDLDGEGREGREGKECAQPVET